MLSLAMLVQVLSGYFPWNARCARLKPGTYIANVVVDRSER